MKQCVSDETRSFMEEQFAECREIMDVAYLYSDFLRILEDLFLDTLDSVAKGSMKG